MKGEREEIVSTNSEGHAKIMRVLREMVPVGSGEEIWEHSREDVPVARKVTKTDAQLTPPHTA